MHALLDPPQGGVSAPAPAAGAASAPVETAASTSAWGAWTPASNLNADEFATGMNWAVHELIPMDSVAVLYGSSYAGKSTLAVHLASCFVSGAPFFGRTARLMPCFYLALENVRDVKAHVLAAMKQGAAWTQTLAISGQHVDLGDAGETDALAAEIRRLSGGVPSALIIDALLDGIGSRDVTSNADMGPVMRHVHAIAEAIGGPVILVHHANRTAEKTVLGASVILTSADVHVRIEGSKAGSSWEAEKVKGAVRIEPRTFGFRSVPLGRNGAGQDVSSCVIVEQGTAKPKPKKKAEDTPSKPKATTKKLFGFDRY